MSVRTTERRVALPAPDAAAQARGFLEQALAGWGSPTSRDYVQRIVRELVTNATRRGAVPVELCTEVETHEVRIVLRVGSTEHPSLEAEASFGRGLVVVDILADGWGVSPSPTGTVVWFVINAGR